MSRHMEAQKSSEWPSFRPENNRPGRSYPGAPSQTLSTGDFQVKMNTTSSTPMTQSHSPVVSRRSSPRGFVGEGVVGNPNARSVPATPLGTITHNSTSGSSAHASKSGTPALPMSQDSSGIGQFVGMGGGSDIGNRYSGSFDSPGGYGLQQGLDDRVSAGELLLRPI
jgi:hypothetical protein